MALDSSPEQPQPLRRVAQGVEQWIARLGWIWTEGQLIEINRRSGSSLVFLTLRDKLGEVSVSVATTPQVLDAAGPVPEGATVVAHLKPRFFLRSGRMSFDCDDLRVMGEGMLLARLEQTKRMLQAEGLFDPRRKRRLPTLPRVIGLVTAEGSAAERDVCENVARRCPAATIRAAHALVQGPQAVDQLLAAVRRLDAAEDVDVIVVARGGGSLEDLLPFSNEALVRLVADCRTPVVSAIGHEVDSPILDLVADARASTPTDAAKLVVPPRNCFASTRRGSGCTERSPYGCTASPRRWRRWSRDRCCGLRPRRSRSMPTRWRSSATGCAVPSNAVSRPSRARWTICWRGAGRCRRAPPWSAATPSRSTARATR